MNAAQMKAKLAEIRFEHENGVHDFDEDSDHVQREACTSCFLIGTIDTMVARSWDPTTGGPALDGYMPEGGATKELGLALDEAAFDRWVAEIRGVASPAPIKDRILLLMTTSGVRVDEVLGKTLIVAFAGEIEERTKRAILERDAAAERAKASEPEPISPEEPAGRLDLARIIGQGIIDEIRRQG